MLAYCYFIVIVSILFVFALRCAAVVIFRNIMSKQQIYAKQTKIHSNGLVEMIRIAIIIRNMVNISLLCPSVSCFYRAQYEYFENRIVCSQCKSFTNFTIQVGRSLCQTLSTQKIGFSSYFDICMLKCVKFTKTQTFFFLSSRMKSFLFISLMSFSMVQTGPLFWFRVFTDQFFEICSVNKSNMFVGPLS